MVKRTRKKQSAFRGKVAKDAKRRASHASTYGYLQLSENINVFSAEPDSRIKMDIIPYVVGEKNHPDRDSDGCAEKDTMWFKRPFKIHRNIGAQNLTVVCPTSIGKKCPICEYRIKNAKSGDLNEDDLKALKPSLRNLYYIIPLTRKNEDRAIFLFDMSDYLFQEKIDKEVLEDEDYEAYPELDGGYTLKIRFESKSFGGSNPYAEVGRVDFEERDEDYDESILDGLASLETFLIVKDYDELNNLFFELDEEDIEDEDEEEEKHTKRTAKTTRKRKPEPEPEDEEYEEDEDEEYEDEEEDEEYEEDEDIEEEYEEDEDEEEIDIPIKERCVACEGTGLNSKGDTCPICKGTGRKPKNVKKAGKPIPMSKKTKSTRPTRASKNKCPYGHKFGKDCEQFEDCTVCDLWDECAEA